MSKPPTAEEVLGLYLKWNKTEEEFDEFRMQCRDEGEVHDFAMDVINDKEAFLKSLEQWQASHGPVTREWFMERFGSLSHDNGEVGLVWLRDDSVTLGLRIDGERWYYTRLHNPTRERIETLVEMLGGTQ